MTSRTRELLVCDTSFVSALTCDRDFLLLRELGVKVVYVARRPLGLRSG